MSPLHRDLRTTRERNLWMLLTMKSGKNSVDELNKDDIDTMEYFSISEIQKYKDQNSLILTCVLLGNIKWLTEMLVIIDNL